MKTTIIAITLLLSLNGYSQTTKQDSLQQIKVNMFIDSLAKNTSVYDFDRWIYKTMTGEKRDEFLAIWNLFVNMKYEEWVNEQKKLKRE